MRGVADLDETIRLTKQALKLRRPLFEAAFEASDGYGFGSTAQEFPSNEI